MLELKMRAYEASRRLVFVVRVGRKWVYNVESGSEKSRGEPINQSSRAFSVQSYRWGHKGKWVCDSLFCFQVLSFEVNKPGEWLICMRNVGKCLVT